MSLALQGRFLTTGPSGRPQQVTFCVSLLHYQRSPLETLKSYCYSPHSLFLAFMLGIGVIIKMTSHFALCLSLATEASCHMFISGSALLQSFSTERFFSPRDMWQCLQTFLVITTRELGRGEAGI